MPAYLNAEWLNQNEQRAYPLSDSGTALDTTGTFTLPDEFLVGLFFPVSAGLAVAAENVYLQRVTLFGSGLTVSLGYDDGSASPPTVATAVVPYSSHREFTPYALPGSGDFADCVGKLVIGRLETVRQQAAGDYRFGPPGGRLDPDCVRPVLQGLSSLVLVNGSERSTPLTGDIELTAGSNARFTVTQVAGVSQVRVDAIEGAGLNAECACTTTATPVRFINDVAPTADGRFTLTGTDCMTISPGTNGLKIDDTCSKPCCGCAELEVVTAAQQQLEREIATLEQFVNRLNTEVTTMNLRVLGSRLSDAGCNPA